MKPAFALLLLIILTPSQAALPVAVDGSEFNEILAGAKIGEIRESSLQRGLVSYLQVVEVEVDQIAWEAGIRKDDIFYSINKQLIQTLDEAADAFASNRRSIILNIQRGNRELYLVIK